MIGNFVNVKGDCEHNPFTVGGMKKDGKMWLVYLEEADTWYELRLIEPIKLTAVILVNSNFGGDFPNDHYYGDIKLSLDLGDWSVVEADEEGWDMGYTIGGYGTEIRYVHQLQNALNNCGKTFEIKL